MANNIEEKQYSGKNERVYRVDLRIFKGHPKRIVVAVLIAMLISFVLILVVHNKLLLTQQPFVAKLIPTYHSIRKASDILFAPYFLRKTTLSIYELSIAVGDVKKLNASLPENPFGTESLNNLPRVYVPARFKSGEYDDEVEIRYRGSLGNHWNSYKKSLLVIFPKENLFNGMRELTLVIPSDRMYFTMPLNNYRGKKLGLLVPEEEFVRVHLNGTDYGVYLAFEHWSQEWIEKKPIAATSNLLGTRTREGQDNKINLLTDWNSWNTKGETFEEITAFNQIVANTTKKDFKKLIPHIFNLEKAYAINILTVLAGSYHTYGSNTVFIFNSTTGLFEPVPYNTTLFYAVNDGPPPEFIDKILSIPEYKQSHDALLDAYVVEEKENDIRFVDSWRRQYNSEFFSDTAKLDSNFAYLNYIKRVRADFLANFGDENELKIREYDPTYPERTTLDLPKKFEYLKKIVYTPEKFVAENSDFYLEDGAIAIYPGAHVLKGVIIIPSGTTLTIHPGTTLYMQEDASIISYSPVIARGTSKSTIRIVGARSQKPWGVFAVMNTKEESSFEYIEFKGGSEKTLGGVLISGTLALHNAPVTISRALFKDAHGDDALNIKEGSGLVEKSVFSENISDAIDVDFPKGELSIVNNTFRNNGGDAIDISWSDITIRDNMVDVCGDKGISVGERSHPTISNMMIHKCDIGIAIKDSSHATIHSTEISNSRVGISAYNKKPHFKGGSATVEDVVFKNVAIEYEEDIYSDITIDS